MICTQGFCSEDTGSESESELGDPNVDDHGADIDDNEAEDASRLQGIFKHKDTHRRLDDLIKSHQARLQGKDAMLTGAKAAGALFDLHALANFNDIRLKLQRKAHQKIEEINNTPRHLRGLMKKSKSNGRPTHDAALRVAQILQRGPSYAQTLRDNANYMLRTGLMHMSNQGKGAFHATYLDYPEVIGRLRRFVNQLVPQNEGGLTGRVSYPC